MDKDKKMIWVEESKLIAMKQYIDGLEVELAKRKSNEMQLYFAWQRITQILGIHDIWEAKDMKSIFVYLDKHIFFDTKKAIKALFFSVFRAGNVSASMKGHIKVNLNEIGNVLKSIAPIAEQYSLEYNNDNDSQNGENTRTKQLSGATEA